MKIKGVTTILKNYRKVEVINPFCKYIFIIKQNKCLNPSNSEG